MLRQAMLDRNLMGIRVCRRASTINHLLFMDSIFIFCLPIKIISFIFCKTTPKAYNHLLKILNKYALELGQCINHEKTIMVFSCNVKEKNRAEIYTIWGCSETKQYEKYLALTPIIGRFRKRAFFKIKTKV